MSRPFDDDELNALLIYAVKEGYLESTTLENGKTYYRRTSKPLPFDDKRLQGMFEN
jgi:hypothetical protein